MTLKSLAASLVLAIGFSQAAIAADNKALAENYVNLPEVQLMMDNMFTPESAAAQFASSLPPNITITDDQLQRIGILMSDTLQEIRPKLEQQMIDSSAEVFTAEELTALIEFYSSEHGAAIMSKMQPLMQSAMSGIAGDMQRATQQITPELTKIMQE
ncbi:DUF2059 domain-containing protein [Ruegeria atlantica]|uniref:DUF2059 domain-containing protein n=1 Tax=Ruegeria atlantica TaxID=81569 RepID=UPI001480F946